MDGLEGVAVQPVQPLASFATHVNRSHLSKHTQVLGHLWLTQPEQAHQVVHGALPAGKDVQDLSPPGLGHRVERLVEVEGVDPSKREEVLGIIRERIIPGLKEIEGFAGFISLIDEENRRARSVVLWETREGADEGERQFAAKREEVVRGIGGTVRSADLYEAQIVEILTGVRA